MATITSAGSGLWSNGAVWVGGVVPVDNDTVLIASGHVVEFDVDTSGFANGIAGITITGTLSLTRTPGTYYMKLKAATTIGGAGTFDTGSLASPIPFAAKHTVTGGSGWQISGASGMTMTVYDAEPAIETVRLTQNEAAGATILHVDTDVTGDIWAVGNSVYISDINGIDHEERIIAAAGIAAGTITITAGLSAAKSAGAYVSLMTRNLRFVGLGNYLLNGFTAGKFSPAGGEFTVSNYTLIYGSSDIVISGGTYYASVSIINTVSGMQISGGMFFRGAFGGTGHSISGGTFQNVLNSSTGQSITGGTFVGNNFSGATGSISGAKILGASSALINCAFTIKNTTINGSGNTDIYQSIITAFNTLFGSSTENQNYTALAREIYSESYDHDQVAGAYKAWTKGGVTSSQAVTVPTGYTQAMQTVLQNATVEGYWQREVTVGAGASVNITSYLRKAASMTYLPRVIIFNKASTDPFAGGAGLHTFAMTNSIDTWESEVYTYTNSGTADVTLVIRTQGMAASGSVYSVVDVEQINVDLTAALAKLDAILVDTGTDIPAAITAIPDSVVEGTVTIEQALRLILSALAGKASGGGTTTITFRDTGDSKDRIVATVDANGNRTDVVLDAT